MKNKIYPFKHLAAYERDDIVFYKGREKEINELYQMTFETDLLLVFGASGVGKTSLIRCGLANKFMSYEWLDISVRRGNNINESLQEELNCHIKPKKANSIAEQIRLLRQQCFCPVYLIFDQFEELYISGDEQEQEQFYSSVREILSLNQPVKIIISIREEYFGYLYDFEKKIPQLFSHKCWIKPKSVKTDEGEKTIIDEILQGVVKNEDKSNVHIENCDKLAKVIQSFFEEDEEDAVKKTKNKDKLIDLPSLQILFHEFYFHISNGRDFGSNEITTFKANEFEKFLEKKKITDVNDLVWNYLENFVSNIIENKEIQQNIVWGFLLELVTDAGTKKHLTEKMLKENADFSESEIAQIKTLFEKKNDEKDEYNIINATTLNGVTSWELRHDALAKCISEKMDSEQRLKKLVEVKMDPKSQDDLTLFQLNEIKENLEKRLRLNRKQLKWVVENRIRIKAKIKAEEKAQEAELKKKEAELIEKKRKLKETRLLLSIATFFFVIAVLFGIYAYKMQKEVEHQKVLVVEAVENLIKTSEIENKTAWEAEQESNKEEAVITQPESPLPTLSTNTVTTITTTTAIAGGRITNAGTPTYTERGVCYATTKNPTIANQKIAIKGAGTGNFTANLTGLSTNTTYYVRAYVVHEEGLIYGEQVSFTTPFIEMVAVQGGTFIMGCSSEQDEVECDDIEKPSHIVTVGSFSIGKYPVTQKQWKTIMGTDVRQQRDKANKDFPIDGEGDEYPMYYVSWNEVQEFISKLNERTGKQYRLPTEAEWEFAARGGNSRRGYIYSGSNQIDDVAWYTGNSTRTHPVGTKAPNELGIYDMSGYVWEWCSDWYGAYTATAKTNPTGPDKGSSRVLRGGSWCCDAQYCRVSDRYYLTPDNRGNYIGFRLVLVQ